jgi:hypothetical protein
LRRSYQTGNKEGERPKCDQRNDHDQGNRRQLEVRKASTVIQDLLPPVCPNDNGGVALMVPVGSE